MPPRASLHPGSPNSPSCSALAWYSCWPGLSLWAESWKRTRVARTAALTRYRYATQPAIYDTHTKIVLFDWFTNTSILIRCNVSMHYERTHFSGRIFLNTIAKPLRIIPTNHAFLFIWVSIKSCIWQRNNNFIPYPNSLMLPRSSHPKIIRM